MKSRSAYLVVFGMLVIAVLSCSSNSDVTVPPATTVSLADMTLTGEAIIQTQAWFTRQQKTQPPAILPTAATFDEAAYVNSVQNALFILAGGRNVVSVRVPDGRPNGGERNILVSYLTTESTEVGEVDEWIDLFDAIATAIQQDKLDVDSVSLLEGSPTAQPIRTLESSVSDLLAFHNGVIDRATFLNHLHITTF